MEQLLTQIIANPELHARWLNTLSYLENCGARLIAACEHPTLVREEMLKHAAEEFRHAHYLKRQIGRIWPHTPIDYSPPNILGGTSTLQYLSRLNLIASRHLSTTGLPLRPAAYLLVTYAIEIRAAQFYPLYDRLLRAVRSPITVKSILLEEKEHLDEMRRGIELLAHGTDHAEQICLLERHIYQNWLGTLSQHL
jgi:hypothetical protein